MQDVELKGLGPVSAAKYMASLADDAERERVRQVYLQANQIDLANMDRASTRGDNVGVWQPSVQPNGAAVIAWGLILCGIILAGYAFFFFDVSAGESFGQEVANLERVASRTMAMIAGVGAVVAGSVLYVGDKIFTELTRPR